MVFQAVCFFFVGVSCFDAGGAHIVKPRVDLSHIDVRNKGFIHTASAKHIHIASNARGGVFITDVMNNGSFFVPPQIGQYDSTALEPLRRNGGVCNVSILRSISDGAKCIPHTLAHRG